METRNYWEEGRHGVKYDNYNTNEGFGRATGELNFAAAPSEDEADYAPGFNLKKGKVSRQDPMSHRIIEKRRRDRMNNCLADLSRLIPPEYLKKGRGRVEKTEIIEMAIRHLKYLQERANAVERLGDGFRVGYQEAAAEAVRFLVEVQGCGPGDGLCVQLASHLHRRCENVIKVDVNRDKAQSQPGSVSETTSYSGSSDGFIAKPLSVITAAHPPAPPAYSAETFDERPADQPYPMECDRAASTGQVSVVVEDEVTMYTEPLSLDGSCKREPTLRAVRKPEHSEDYLHSYKFKNSIERRFSRSQDNEAAAVLARAAPLGKAYSHKRRRQAKPAPSTSTSNSGSGSTEEARDTSPQDTSSESPHTHPYEKPTPAQYVPVFALNAHGKFYVPLSVEYACLARHLRPYDMLDSRSTHIPTPLHPVTIHVNFQPCLNYHVKPEPGDREWRDS